MKARRLGLFGGTFDPPHFGHVAALRAAVRTNLYDHVEVTVAGDPYLKSGSGQLRPASLRLAMAHAAFDDIEGVEVSDREIRRNGPSYTIDTVRELLDAADAVDLVIGADLAGNLDSWHQAAELATLVRVGVVPRPGTLTKLPEKWDAYEIPMDPVDLSSTFIRAALASHENLSNFLPESVIPLYQGA